MSEFELQPPPVEARADEHEGLWGGETFDVVPLDLPIAETVRRIACGQVDVFDDPFTVWEIPHSHGIARVTVYASNYDGALCKGAVDPELRDAIATRYGIHRWSEPDWRRN